MAVPYTFATATSAIPLSNLDSNFATAITLGSTATYLGNTTTTIAGLTLTSPTLTTPALGTPSSGVLTNCTGYPSSAISGTISLTTQVTGTLPVANGGTGVTTSTGTGNVVLSTTPTLVTPILGTPTSGTLTNTTGFPAANLAGTALPSAIVTSSLTAVGTIATGVWNGTTIAIANGGTGQTTASAGFNALSPITTTGDLIIGNGTNSATRLAIGANTYVLTSNGTTASWVAPSGGGSGTVNSGTAYQLAYYATTGTAVSTLGSLGTSGQVLTSGGAGVAPSWVTPSSGAMTLISTQTASNSASLSWTGLTGYSNYILILRNIKPDATGANAGAYVQLGSGSTTWATSSYQWTLINYNVSGVNSPENDTAIGVSLDSAQQDNNRQLAAQVNISQKTSTNPEIYFFGTIQWPGTALRGLTGGGMYYGDTNTITAIRFLYGSGLVASGSASLYGISS